MNQARAKKLKLMVVDDEPDNLDLLYRTFRRDFKVFKADGALSALKILDTEGEMSVIISDQRMPVMNGTEFLSKTVDRFPDTIRILLTGYTDVEDLVDAINSGKVFKYITKPWNPENLKGLVQQASETYLVLKKRTNELRRALQREEILNVVTSTIRESLDYKSVLQAVVTSISNAFNANISLLRLVEGNTLLNTDESIQPEDADVTPEEVSLMTQAAQTAQTHHQITKTTTEVAVPLTVQQSVIAVLYLQQVDPRQTLQNEADIQLLESVADQAALAISQARLYQQTQQQAEKMRAELEVARQIQRNLLRQGWDETGDVNVQAKCDPAREVGGDFFEVYVHPQGDVWLAVGDVSGKGVPAALFMASAISILRRELAQEVSPEPEAVLKNLNNTMKEDLFSTNCFITMVIARYRPSEHHLVYANAGHLYPMVWSHAQVAGQSSTEPPAYLKDRGIPVGILPQWRGKIGSVQLNTGDVFLLTSDGITEATVLASPNPAQSPPLEPGQMLNQEGLWQLIVQGSAPFNIEELLQRFRDCTNQEQEDDQT
ncbi:MAG: SpoIIE family protein phosphatase, partial [Spirulina sp. SIO3F2]|nr:SpoIIE family protein phosphatase [Spirulina sp. SIO3F2]